MRTIAELAKEALDQFETKKRDDGERFDTLKDGRAEWIQDLAYEAHGDMLPDDWRYSAVRSALEAIADSDAETEDDLDDIGHEFADQNVDVYTGSRLEWLSSHLSRPGYCDEAREQFGSSEDLGLVERVGLGQYLESREVFDSVRRSLAERQDELESAEIA